MESKEIRRKQNKWDLVKKTYINDEPYESRMESIHSRTFGSHMRYIDDQDSPDRMAKKPKKLETKMSFFKAVTEATKIKQ